MCRKSEKDDRIFKAKEKAIELAVSNSVNQISRFWKKGRKLSRNDLKIIILSNLLVKLSPKRTIEHFVLDFSEASLNLSGLIESLYLEQDCACKKENGEKPKQLLLDF